MSIDFIYKRERRKGLALAYVALHLCVRRRSGGCCKTAKQTGSLSATIMSTAIHLSRRLKVTGVLMEADGRKFSFG